MSIWHMEYVEPDIVEIIHTLIRSFYFARKAIVRFISLSHVADGCPSLYTYLTYIFLIFSSQI